MIDVNFKNPKLASGDFPLWSMLHASGLNCDGLGKWAMQFYRICGLCTHLHYFFGGFALGFTAFPCFSFSCFFLHATATLKERSSSASEWSLGLTPKCRQAPPTRHVARHLWFCRCHVTPGYGTLGWNTGNPAYLFASAGTGFTWSCKPCFSRSSRALASAAAFSVKQPPWIRLLLFGDTCTSHFLRLFDQETPSTSLVNSGSFSLGSLRMPFSTSSVRKAVAASRAAASASTSVPPDTMNFFTRNAREVHEIKFPLQSTFGNRTFHPKACVHHRTPLAPLCFASLYLLSLAGFCSTASSKGCSAASIATGASLVSSPLGVASSFCTPTDSKTSRPCVAWLPSADESRGRRFASKALLRSAPETGRSQRSSMSILPICGLSKLISCWALASFLTFTLSAISFFSKLGSSAIRLSLLPQPARRRMWFSMSSVCLFNSNQRSFVSVFVWPFPGLWGPTSLSTLLSPLTFTPSAGIAGHVRRRRLAAPDASKDSMARVGRFSFPGWADRLSVSPGLIYAPGDPEPKMESARHMQDVESVESVAALHHGPSIINTL